MHRFLLVGTDTDVGKTTVAAALCAALLRAGERVVACKPVETGADEHSDLAALRRIVGEDERLRLAAGIRLALAAAPSAAARAAGVSAPTVAACVTLVRQAERAASACVVETCGGALTPLSDEEYVCDIAPALPDYRVVLVAGLRLGVLSHAFAATQYLRAIGAVPHAVVLCDRFAQSPAWYVDSTLEDMRRHGLHVAAVIPHFNATDAQLLARAVSPLVVEEAHGART